ncbi:glycoside hydrolase family 3 protein [Virgibacillus ndiopensis]|uniref:glycoside hydrolase family 3 protein n=1 Tax=Virgibacillus ndiopensis TaxID=2004408 RepID=UPI000C080038|nr:glycoside hydrolase family 3 C-terminal domain-containing protein [Virgibacillus ndiopensis]
MFITGPSTGDPDYLSDLLQEKNYDTSDYATNTSPTASQIAEATERAADADTIIVTSYTANTNAAQQRLVASLMETGKPVIVTAMRNPYDIIVFPEVQAYLATYGNRDVSVKALSRVLSGEVNPEGKLPVTIPGLYDFGHYLSY